MAHADILPALVVHLVEVHLRILPLGENNGAVAVDYGGVQPLRLGERLLYTHEVVLPEDIPEGVVRLCQLHGVLAAEAAHHAVLAVRIKVLGDVEHHSVDEVHAVGVTASLSGYVEPLVVAAAFHTRVYFYLVRRPADDVAYHLAERLVVVRVYRFAHHHGVPGAAERAAPCQYLHRKSLMKAHRICYVSAVVHCIEQLRTVSGGLIM